MEKFIGKHGRGGTIPATRQVLYRFKSPEGLSHQDFVLFLLRFVGLFVCLFVFTAVRKINIFTHTETNLILAGRYIICSDFFVFFNNTTLRGLSDSNFFKSVNPAFPPLSSIRSNRRQCIASVQQVNKNKTRPLHLASIDTKTSFNFLK